MSELAEIERELLGLPAADRERIILKAWESLADDLAAAASPEVDPEGVSLAISREREIDSNQVSAVTHEEFRRRTGGD
jgi:hypothetical protein